MLVECSNCGKEFNKSNYQAKRSKRHFCSKECQYNGYRKTDEEKFETKKRYQKKYRQQPEVKEKLQKYQQQYQQDNKDKIRENARKWYAENKEEQQRKYKENYSKNIEKNREKSKKRQKKWKRENPEAYEISRLKNKLNPLNRYKQRVRQSINRAKKHNCFIGDKQLLLDKYIEILTIEEIDCYYCGEKCGTTVANYLKDITVDHKIPLSRGGDHDINNLVHSCRQCNSLKEKKTEEEYREYLIKINKLKEKLQ